MLPFLQFILLLLLSSKSAWSEVVSEGGYTVSTVLDGNKLLTPIHPFSLLPRGSKQQLLLLDSSASAFYTLSLPISQNSEIVLFSGKRIPGFADGDSEAAMFDHPRSFTVDSKGNVYVADRSNHAIRKISNSGVTTTIAGGYSEKTGHNDGPAQNASFSNDFEIVFVPKMCALLISDRGNRLVRQMDLKAEDCRHESQSGLGMASASVVAILCLLFGSVIGFIARPFLTSHDFSSGRRIKKTWKHYQTNLGIVARTIFSGIRSVVADSTPYMLLYRFFLLNISYLVCMFRIPRLEKKPVPSREPISLIDSDMIRNHGLKSSLVFSEQLNDLIGFDDFSGVLEMQESNKQEDVAETLVSNGSVGRIDEMIRANVSDFSICSNSGLVKRRDGRVDGVLL